MVSGRAAAALLGAASMTCSIMVAAFVRSCRQAFSTYVLLVSMLCIHTVVSIRSLFGRNCVSFYLSSLTSMSNVYPFACRVLMSVSVYETRFPRNVNISISFRELPFSGEMSLWLKHIYSVLCVVKFRPIPAAACSRLYRRVSAWWGVFARSAMSSVKSASVIVCAGYLLLLSFVSLKLSFILSIDVLSTQSRQIIKRYGAKVSPPVHLPPFLSNLSPSRE